MTPLKAIRETCRDCGEGTARAINDCKFGQNDLDRLNCPKACPLYALRFEKRVKGFNVLKQIKRYCLWCCNEQPNEIKLCADKLCPLWPYRLGHNPSLKGKRGNSEALKKWREKRKPKTQMAQTT